MSAAEEEARALEHRLAQARRAANRAAREAVLHGDPQARRELGESWEPIFNRNQPADEHLP